MNAEILEQIGLTKSEIKVYLALLELGSSSTGKIIDKSKASSSKIYEILDKLMRKGLVSFIIKSGVKYFEAAPVERIMDYMKEKEKTFSQQKKELEKILPELKLKRTISKYKSEATIYKGIKGGETAFKYMINKMKKGDEWIASIISYTNKDYYNLISKIHLLRIEKGLKARLIFNEKHRYDLHDREKHPLTKIKLIPYGIKSPAIVNVAGNITLLNIMSEEISVFMIESKEVADSFRDQFEKLWSQKAHTITGFGAVTSKFQSAMEEMKPGEKYYVLNATYGKRGKRLLDFFMNYHRERIKRGIKLKLISVKKAHNLIKKEFTQTGDPKMKLSELKTMKNELKQPMQINLYEGNKVLLFLWGEEMTCFEIESKILYDNFKEQFDAEWKQGLK